MRSCATTDAGGACGYISGTNRDTVNWFQIGNVGVRVGDMYRGPFP